MKSNNILELIKGQDIVIPNILIKNKKTLNSPDPNNLDKVKPIKTEIPSNMISLTP